MRRAGDMHIWKYDKVSRLRILNLTITKSTAQSTPLKISSKSWLMAVMALAISFGYYHRL